MHLAPRRVSPLLALAALSGPALAQLPFASTVTPSDVGLGSMGVTAADLDGDGDLDLVTGLHALPSHGLGLWTRQGDGSYLRTGFLPIPGRATEVRAADLDHDGDVDLVVSNFTPANSVSVLEQTAPGVFVRTDHFVAAIPTRLELADLNGDGDLDIAYSLRSVADHSVGVLMNTGGTSYGPPTTYLVGFGPNDVAVGDLDGDGDLDLVSADTDSDTVSVLRNQGGGTFDPSTQIAVGSYPRRVAVGDVNGDQVLDIVVTHDLTAAVTCLHGDGSGAFPTRADHPISLRGRDVTLADLDGDGRLDIALGVGFIDHVLVLRSLGGGAFAPAQQLPTGYEPFSIVAVDLDGDGDVDLATADDGVSGTPSLSVLENLRFDGPGTAYCFGVGCPCGNDDALGGCANSTGAGARLGASGSASVAADDLVLRAEGLPASQFGLLYMGPQTTSVPLFAGLRCVDQGAVGLFRFPVGNADAQGVLTLGPGVVAASQGFGAAGSITAGSTWHFQAWFRDPADPCGLGATTSNAYTVTFRP